MPSKQDNVTRGTLRDGRNLNFQNTVRAISSRIDLAAGSEDLAARIDHDNASVASAAAFDPLRRLPVRRARDQPRSGGASTRTAAGRSCASTSAARRRAWRCRADGRSCTSTTSWIARSACSISRRCCTTGRRNAPLARHAERGRDREAHGATCCDGKQFFYDARDPRLARDRYMSCATCHNDGGHDGRVWDLTGMGEGLRNTISLRGRARHAHGFLHWSDNFDEVQDFEGQIRALAGGTGLMTDAAFNTARAASRSARPRPA